MSFIKIISFFINLAIPFIFIISLIALFGLLVIVAALRRHCRSLKSKSSENRLPNVAFFHPYCNTGGGGERVLWCAVKALQNRYPGIKLAIYTGDLESSPEEILNRVNQRFNITLPAQVDFVYLRRRRWVEAKMYPYFTLLGQSLGSIILGIEALFLHVPDVFIDTMGYAFTMPIFKYIAECHVACYVHYPTITSDMLSRVSSRAISHNNRRFVARSPFLTAAKILYYKFFAWLYGKVGGCADTVMVNSTWTEEHIHELWGCPLKTHRVYPPCDVTHLKTISIDEKKEEDENKVIKIVSVAQYRPEKDHPLQLRSMYQLRRILPEEIWDNIKLVFVGSCRNEEDEERVRDMKDLCKHLSLENNVEFKVNAPFEELLQQLKEGTIGLHAMWNEHFGIGVVECMAAGLIMIAHRSGGPQMDIIEEAEGSRTGFLAETEVEYANAIATIIMMPPDIRNIIRNAARASVDRFSVPEFEQGFLRAMSPFLVKS